MENKLKIIPYYAKCNTLEEALKNKKAKKLLWLEILLNDAIDWGGKLRSKTIRESYRKACLWYGNFKSLIEAQNIKIKPLPFKPGPFDDREYRTFLEVLNFVGA